MFATTETGSRVSRTPSRAIAHDLQEFDMSAHYCSVCDSRAQKLLVTTCKSNMTVNCNNSDSSVTRLSSGGFLNDETIN